MEADDEEEPPASGQDRADAGETSDLRDLDPNAEEQARRVERQLRRVRREMRG